jgi:creatinine amidohydrolase
VHRPHYKRENNEVVEGHVAHQTTTEFRLSRKTASAMRIGLASQSLLMLIVGGVASLGTGSAQAGPRAYTDLLEFEKMTWVEVRAALAAGKTTALIYTGGVEERGPQNANGGHNLIARATVEAIARRLGSW